MQSRNCDYDAPECVWFDNVSSVKCEDNIVTKNCKIHYFPVEECGGGSIADVNGQCRCPDDNSPHDNSEGNCGSCNNPTGTHLSGTSSGQSCIGHCVANCGSAGIDPEQDGTFTYSCTSTGIYCAMPPAGGGDTGGGDTGGGGTGGGDTGGGGTGGGDTGGGDTGGGDTGGGGGGTGSGDEDGDPTGTASASCEAPPVSSGDAQLDAILKQVWYLQCYGEEVKKEDFTNALKTEGLQDSDDFNFENYKEDKSDDITGIVNNVFASASTGGGGSCPFQDESISTHFGSFVFPVSNICPVMPYIRSMILLLGYLQAGVILFGALTRSGD